MVNAIGAATTNLVKNFFTIFSFRAFCSLCRIDRRESNRENTHAKKETGIGDAAMPSGHGKRFRNGSKRTRVGAPPDHKPQRWDSCFFPAAVC